MTDASQAFQVYGLHTVVRLLRDRTSERMAPVPMGTVGRVVQVTQHGVMMVRVETSASKADTVSVFPGEVEEL